MARERYAELTDKKKLAPSKLGRLKPTSSLKKIEPSPREADNPRQAPKKEQANLPRSKNVVKIEQKNQTQTQKEDHPSNNTNSFKRDFLTSQSLTSQVLSFRRSPNLILTDKNSVTGGPKQSSNERKMATDENTGLKDSVRSKLQSKR